MTHYFNPSSNLIHSRKIFLSWGWTRVSTLIYQGKIFSHHIISPLYFALLAINFFFICKMSINAIFVCHSIVNLLLTSNWLWKKCKRTKTKKSEKLKTPKSKQISWKNYVKHLNEWNKKKTFGAFNLLNSTSISLSNRFLDYISHYFPFLFSLSVYWNIISSFSNFYC